VRDRAALSDGVGSPSGKHARSCLYDVQGEALEDRSGICYLELDAGIQDGTLYMADGYEAKPTDQSVE
jgi:hypothetical protein